MIEDILKDYSSGGTISMIAEKHGKSETDILNMLREYKAKSKNGKSFSDELKVIIARRDSNGVYRADIAKELQLNITTVRTSCEKFGRAIKDSEEDDSAYTVIEGDFEIGNCISCGSRRNNEVGQANTYCMDCGDEYLYYDGYVMKVNFENID